LGEAQSLLSDDDSCTRSMHCRALNLYLQGSTNDALTALESGPWEFPAMRAFVSASAGDLASADAAADTARASDLDDLSAVLAATAKVIVKGELGRDGELEPAIRYARAIGARSIATSFYRFAMA